MDDKQLIQAAQRGDVQSFNRLVSEYQGAIYHTAYRILGDGSAASDATQDALIAAFKHIHSFRGGSFRAWLARIVTNCCYDQMRNRRARPAVSLEALLPDFSDSEDALGESREESPQDSAERRELGYIIQKGLELVPPDQRVTLILADIQGFSYEEIAQITAVNIGTVKSRLSRARAYMREFLIAQEGIVPNPYRYKGSDSSVAPIQTREKEKNYYANQMDIPSPHFSGCADPAGV